MSEIEKKNKLKKIYRCEECNHVFDRDVRKDNDGVWGHICKAKNYRHEHRCESYLDEYIPKQQLKPILDLWDRMTAVDEPWEDRIEPEEIKNAIRQVAEGVK